jgi:SAM-dependent methyltransferase
VLAHLPALLPRARFSGCDPDPRAVAAAQAALRGVDVAAIAMAPPTPYRDASFDAIYGLSVLTHLPAAAAEQWIAELARLLAPHGAAIVSTHGSRAAARLAPRDRVRFNAGEYVTLSGARSGSRTFASYFGEALGREMLGRAFADVAFVPAPEERFVQDIWVLRRPRRSLGA